MLHDLQHERSVQRFQALHELRRIVPVHTRGFAAQRDYIHRRLRNAIFALTANSQPVSCKGQGKSVLRAGDAQGLQNSITEQGGVGQDRKLLLQIGQHLRYGKIWPIHDAGGKRKVLFRKYDMFSRCADLQFLAVVHQRRQLFQRSGRNEEADVPAALTVALGGRNAEAVRADRLQTVRTEDQVHAFEHGSCRVLRNGKRRSFGQRRNAAHRHGCRRARDLHARVLCRVHDGNGVLRIPGGNNELSVFHLKRHALAIQQAQHSREKRSFDNNTALILDLRGDLLLQRDLQIPGRNGECVLLGLQIRALQNFNRGNPRRNALGVLRRGKQLCAVDGEFHGILLFTQRNRIDSAGFPPAAFPSFVWLSAVPAAPWQLAAFLPAPL